MSPAHELYQTYKEQMQRIADVKYASAVLQWDQETYLPAKGNEGRGRQIATLTEMAHRQFTDPALGDLLQKLSISADLAPGEKRNVELSLEDYERAIKFPPAFVRNMSETVNRSFHSWIQARKENSFAVFHNDLDAVIALKKEEAAMIGYQAHPYDALMNDYDKGLTVAQVDELFTNLRPSLSELLQLIKQQPQVDDHFLYKHFPKDKQWDIGLKLLSHMGFDFQAGRQDLSEHPFTTNFNNQDVRVTTRIDENDLGNMTWSCIHEGGHALYEQGLPGNQYGLPLGEYCSLSIHESQSRLWENNIGRSLPFWKHEYHAMQSAFPENLQSTSLEQFYRGINKVKPSLIRTEADELTYHFHIMIRYELEKKLIDGSLRTNDIPGYWAEQYHNYLGIKVPDDRRGCLQDVHWSHGSFGYFATYSIGSLYAAQLYEAILLQNPHLSNDISNAGNRVILQWLKQHIFQFGRYYSSGELCRKATGELLNSQYFITYATKKFTDIYVL